MPKYAAVCIWRSRDTSKVLPHHFGHHACMMLIDSEQPLEKLPIQETLMLEDKVVQDDFVDISIMHQDSSNRFKGIDFALQPGVKMDAFLSIGFETTHPSVTEECELYGRSPDEYVLLPTNENGKIGVDYQKIRLLASSR